MTTLLTLRSYDRQPVDTTEDDADFLACVADEIERECGSRPDLATDDDMELDYLRWKDAMDSAE